MNNPEFFPIQSLTFDPDLQIRVKINEETLALYAEQMATEDDMKTFPPVEIFYDGVKHRLADGHHRRAAAEMAGHDKVWAIVKSGTRDDALWGAILGNGKQGFGLTKEDRRRAIFLAIKRFPDKSNRTIADAFGCNEKTIRIYRDSVAEFSATEPERRTGKDGKQYKSKKGTLSTTSAKRRLGITTSVDPPSAVQVPLAVEESDGDTYPEPPCPNKHIKFFPKTTLKRIPQESPRVLLVNLFEIFRKGFVEEMVVMAMGMLAEERSKDVTETILAQLNQTYGQDDSATPSELSHGADSGKVPADTLPEAVVVSLKSRRKVAEKYSCGVIFEPDPDDDYFDWITDEERAELKNLQAICPNRIVPSIHNFTIQNIPEHKPDQLINCLFALFKQNYRKKLLLHLAREMRKEDGEEWTQAIITELYHEYQDGSTTDHTSPQIVHITESVLEEFGNQ
jgi:hypothetical protein